MNTSSAQRNTAQPGPDLDSRVESAAFKLASLAARVEALFGRLAEPPPTPPWKEKESEASAESLAASEEQALELQGVYVELRAANRQLRIAEADRQSAIERAEHAEELAASPQHIDKDDSLEVESMRSALDRVRRRAETAEDACQRLQTQLDAEVARPAPAQSSGVDIAALQELHFEYERLRRDHQELGAAHQAALEQIAGGIGDAQVTEDSVVRALRAEDSMKQMQQHLQRQLLEYEDLRRDRDRLRQLNEENQREVRKLRRGAKNATSKNSEGTSSGARVEQLEKELAARDKELGELRGMVKEQGRELEQHERRQAHLRRHLASRGGRG